MMTKTQVREDIAYIRRQLREMERALKTNDADALLEVAREVSGVSGTIESALDHSWGEGIRGMRGVGKLV